MNERNNMIYSPTEILKLKHLRKKIKGLDGNMNIVIKVRDRPNLLVATIALDEGVCDVEHIDGEQAFIIASLVGCSVVEE